jgi:hypothetical protein
VTELLTTPEHSQDFVGSQRSYTRIELSTLSASALSRTVFGLISVVGFNGQREQHSSFSSKGHSLSTGYCRLSPCNFRAKLPQNGHHSFGTSGLDEGEK